MVIRRGVVVRPKFYSFVDQDSKAVVKLKGVAHLNEDEFFQVIKTGKASFTRFAKFRESLRRGITPNAILDVVKAIGIEDDKREWPDKFSKDALQSSTPRVVNELTPEFFVTTVRS
jgi:hypothetical protein